MTFAHTGGAWYYMVAPLNPYAVGKLSNIGYTYVQSLGEQDPDIDGMDLTSGPPGTQVRLTGQNLDVPGRVLIGTAVCPILSVSETELVFVVPVTAYTGDVSFEHAMGDVASPPSPATFVVERIAYVSQSSQDSPDAVATAYKNLCEGAINGAGVTIVSIDEAADRDMRAFDVIIVAHDVASGQFGPTQAAVQAISDAGAQVLAIGGGGEAYLALVFPALNGSSVAASSPERTLYFDETSPIFGSISPTPSPGSTLDISSTDQSFSAFDFGGFPPASLTQYASLSTARSNVVLFDFVAANQSHNFFWGHEGNPEDLIYDSGQELVVSVVRYLANIGQPIPASQAPASF
jgi:hypothetical protein